MQAACSECNQPLIIDDARVPDRPFSVRCPRCQTVVRLQGRDRSGVGPTAAAPLQAPPLQTPPQPAPAPSAAAAPTLPAKPPGASVASIPAVTGPAGEMETLFRTMVEWKASDLHISVGSPPMLRHDGEVKPLPGRAPLTSADTVRMLGAIAPARNRVDLVRRKIVEPQEAYAKAVDKAGLLTAFKRNAVDVSWAPKEALAAGAPAVAQAV